MFYFVRVAHLVQHHAQRAHATQAREALALAVHRDTQFLSKDCEKPVMDYSILVAIDQVRCCAHSERAHAPVAMEGMYPTGSPMSGHPPAWLLECCQRHRSVALV